MSIPDTGKRLREPTVSPEASAKKKQVEKRPKASSKKADWVEVPFRKSLQQKKKKKAVRTSKRLCCAHPEAVLIKLTEGMSYASIPQELEKRVNPDELSVTIQGIKETRPEDLLVELKCYKKDRGRLEIAF